MISLFKKDKNNQVKGQTWDERRDALWKSFLENPKHEWIHLDNIVKRSIGLLFEHLHPEAIRFLENESVLFIPMKGHLSSAFSKLNNGHIILLFPKILKILRSGLPLHGVAILAHELGHLFYQHSYKDINPLEAQKEADLFAMRMGLARELVEVLWDHHDNPSCRQRIEALKEATSLQSKT